MVHQYGTPKDTTEFRKQISAKRDGIHFFISSFIYLLIIYLLASFYYYIKLFLQNWCTRIRLLHMILKN